MHDHANYKPMANQAYDDLFKKIVTCVYLPGQELNEKQLLEGNASFGRTPLREALLRLQKDGLIEIFPRKGMRIPLFTEKQIKDLYQTRKLLEPLMAEEYCSLFSQSDLLAFREKFSAAASLEPFERFQLDYAFHTYLISVTDNEILINMYKALMIQQIHLAMYTSLRLKEAPDEDHVQHESIISALLRENKTDIRDCITMHLNFSLVRSMQVLNFS